MVLRERKFLITTLVFSFNDSRAFITIIKVRGISVECQCSDCERDSGSRTRLGHKRPSGKLPDYSRKVG